MSDSIWKKEISFRRKPKADARDAVEVERAPAAPDAPKQSFLKKEISFSRKPKKKAPEGASRQAVAVEEGDLVPRKRKESPRRPVAPEQSQSPRPQPVKQSFLKKEISFSRKRRSPGSRRRGAPRRAEPKQSFLKKDISFSRKKRDQEIERLVHEATQSLSPSFAPAEPASAETLPTALAEAAVAAMAHAAQAEARRKRPGCRRALTQAQAEAQAPEAQHRLTPKAGRSSAVPPRSTRTPPSSTAFARARPTEPQHVELPHAEPQYAEPR